MKFQEGNSHLNSSRCFCFYLTLFIVWILGSVVFNLLFPLYLVCRLCTENEFGRFLVGFQPIIGSLNCFRLINSSVARSI